MIRGLELLVSLPLPSSHGGKSQRMNQSMTNDLVNHECYEASIKTQPDRVWVFFFQKASTLGGPKLQKTEVPLFRISPYIFLHLAVDLYSPSYP